MSDTKHPAWDRLEPGIEHERAERLQSYYEARPGEHEIELSKAISLKRIADTLDLSNDEGVAHTVWLMAMQGLPRR